MPWALLGILLNLLLTWWMNRKTPPPQRMVALTEHVFAKVKQIQSVAVPKGCRADGAIDAELDGAERPLTAATLEEVETDATEMGALGWSLLKPIVIRAMPMVIDELGLPWARALSARSPLPINYNDADLKALLLETLAESQN